MKLRSDEEAETRRRGAKKEHSDRAGLNLRVAGANLTLSWPAQRMGELEMPEHDEDEPVEHRNSSWPA